jgi:dUTP diphosphatase
VPLVIESGAVMPTYQTEGSAGFDLCSNESFVLEPMERKMVGTGLRMAIPPGYEGQVRPRSGLAAKHGLSMVNTPGTIDCDYRGEVKVILINLGKEHIVITRGERIAQLVICPVLNVRFEIVGELDGTARGEAGFGSTGR